jgi:hypothetical protein
MSNQDSIEPYIRVKWPDVLFIVNVDEAGFGKIAL